MKKSKSKQKKNKKLLKKPIKSSDVSSKKSKLSKTSNQSASSVWVIPGMLMLAAMVGVFFLGFNQSINGLMGTQSSTQEERDSVQPHKVFTKQITEVKERIRANIKNRWIYNDKERNEIAYTNNNLSAEQKSVNPYYVFNTIVEKESAGTANGSNTDTGTKSNPVPPTKPATPDLENTDIKQNIDSSDVDLTKATERVETTQRYSAGTKEFLKTIYTRVNGKYSAKDKQGKMLVEILKRFASLTKIPSGINVDHITDDMVSELSNYGFDIVLRSE